MRKRVLMFALASLLMSLCIPATSQNEFVDLGLSVKWGTVNMGTTDLRPFGWYWTWADAIDIKTTDGSRLATKAEWNELLDYCTWKWTEQDGKAGYLITSNIEGFKDRSIFLPASGWLQDGQLMRQHSYGSYWTSTPGAQPQGGSAYGFNFMSDGIEWHSENRYSEQSVRMVMPISDSEITDIRVDKENITMSQHTTSRLNVMADGRSNVNSASTWKSSDENVVSVMDDGLIVAKKPGECVITVTAFGKDAKCTVNVTPHETEFVDLGLGVLWATCNLGADKPSDSGDYYAWAEIETKDYFNWSTYRYCSTYSDYNAYVDKYTTEGHTGFLLKPDKLERLEDMDDVASVLSGGEWHIPTAQDFEELIEKCNRKTVTVKGVMGMEFESKVPGFEGKKIFFPFSGYMFDDKTKGVGQEYSLWTSTAAENYNTSKYFTNWNDTLVGTRKRSKKFVITEVELYSGDRGRYVGMSVRPVKTHAADNFSAISFPDEHLDLRYGEIRKMVVNMMPVGRPVNEGDIVWSTSDAGVAVVAEGYLTAVGKGSCEITARSADKEAKMTVTVTLPRPEPVDLGLSVKWASANLGASDPKETGAYFAWGETSPKAGFYSGKNYKFGEYSNMWTKYNMGADVYIKGHYTEPDYKETLDLEDDAAAVLLGDGWRMPTADELWELKTGCTWKRVVDTIKIDKRNTQTILKGYIITSNVPGYEGRSIYLPATGFIGDFDCGNGPVCNLEDVCYWTATMGQSLGNDNRVRGLNIRPVMDQRASAERMKLEPDPIKPLTHDAKVDLGLSVLWADCNLGADNPWERGASVAWGETTQKTYYSLYNYKHAKVSKVGMKWTYSKYTVSGVLDNNPIVDSKTSLDLEDDAAHVNWGGDWRMPTKEECRELFEKCEWEETTVNGVSGYRITSMVPGYKKNSIFLPCTSVWFLRAYEDDDPSSYNAGYYLTSELEPGYTGSCVVLYFDPVTSGSRGNIDEKKRDYYKPRIDKDGSIWSKILLSSRSRTVGSFIRPVCPK